jgi:hypothetical protein
MKIFGVKKLIVAYVGLQKIIVIQLAKYEFVTFNTSRSRLRLTRVLYGN